MSPFYVLSVPTAFSVFANDTKIIILQSYKCVRKFPFCGLPNS